MKNTLKILIFAPPNRLILNLRGLLNTIFDHPSIVQVVDFQALVQALLTDEPHLALIDAGWPGDFSWRVVGVLRNMWTATRYIVLAHNEAQLDRAGALGYEVILLEETSTEHLEDALRALNLE